MSIRTASLVLPARRPADVPVDLRRGEAAELLAAWTALWHPSLLAATGQLPRWHPADLPPEPDELHGELVVVPGVSRMKLPSRWCDEVRETAPRNPPPIEPSPDRTATIAAVLEAAGLDATAGDAEIVRDFLALGYAHLQVELITRAMQYTAALDRDQFAPTVVAAARAAVAGDAAEATDGVRRALDMLADARRHYYPVDFYLVDVTLLAESTLGEPLRAKLAGGTPTSLLASGELIEQLAHEHPDSLRALREAIEAETACVVGGLFRDEVICGARSPESLLAALSAGQQAYQRCVGRDVQVFAQYHASAAPLLPEVLSGMGMTSALCAAFDGGRMPLAEQVKTRWEGPSGASIDALSAVPLDVAQPGTWLSLGRRIGDTLLRDHVATVLLAGWPAGGSEYYDDLRRIARFGTALGRLVTLEEYFAVTREAADWSSFRPAGSLVRAAPGDVDVASSVTAFRQDVAGVERQLLEGLIGLLPPGMMADADDAAAEQAVLNPWNSAGARYVGFDPMQFAAETGDEPAAIAAACLPDVPGCGFRTLAARGENGAHPSATRHPHPDPLPKGEGTAHMLRNERLEVVIGASTGAIQSIRAYGDRGTRVSQRLVYHDPRQAARMAGADRSGVPPANVEMIADRIETTRSDAAAGEITAHGWLAAPAGATIAQFVQTVRLLRGVPIVVVDVQLNAEQQIEEASYFASRLAWRDEGAALRRGAGWIGCSARGRRVESPEWVQIVGSQGPITLLPLGLPLHERIGTRMLDTPLVTAGRQQGRFQLAIGLDCEYPTTTALGLPTAGDPSAVKSLGGLSATDGWFVHVSAKNLVLTHLAPLGSDRQGLRARLLETEGRPATSSLAAYRPFRSAQYTDFRGEPTAETSVVDGQVHFHAGPHQWVQIEAEW